MYISRYAFCRYLRPVRRIACTAITVMAIVYTMSAQNTNPSSSAETGVSPPSVAEVAAGRASTTANRWAIAWILGSAIITAWLGWWVLEKSNRAQELTLARYELEIARTKAAQQRVELELSKQQERAATAERELLHAQERLRLDTATIQRIVRPRTIPISVGDPAVQAKYSALNEFEGKRVFLFVAPDLEAQNLAADLWKVCKAASWKPETPRGMLGRPGIAVYSGTAPGTLDWRAGTAVANLINAVFEMSGLDIGAPIVNMPEKNLPPSSQEYARPPGTVAITIGLRDVESQLRNANARELLAEQSKKQK